MGQNGGVLMGDSKVTVRSVERALDILLCFADESSLSMSEIAQRVALHKSTVHRLLASLETKGFVIRDPVTDHYRLGFRVWELSEIGRASCREGWEIRGDGGG